MSDYQIKMLTLSKLISKNFFSEPRSANVEKAASKIFGIFEDQVKNKDDKDTMMMMLKILVAEGVLMYGARETRTDQTKASA